VHRDMCQGLADGLLHESAAHVEPDSPTDYRLGRVKVFIPLSWTLPYAV
jgi:hypothetical protein